MNDYKFQVNRLRKSLFLYLFIFCFLSFFIVIYVNAKGHTQLLGTVLRFKNCCPSPNASKSTAKRPFTHILRVIERVHRLVIDHLIQPIAQIIALLYHIRIWICHLTKNQMKYYCSSNDISSPGFYEMNLSYNRFSNPWANYIIASITLSIKAFSLQINSNNYHYLMAYSDING